MPRIRANLAILLACFGVGGDRHAESIGISFTSHLLGVILIDWDIVFGTIGRATPCESADTPLGLVPTHDAAIPLPLPDLVPGFTILAHLHRLTTPTKLGMG